MSPSRVLSRYAPLVAVLAVQAMLVLGAPTGSTTVSNAAGGPTGAAPVEPHGTMPNGGVPGAPGSVPGQVGGGQAGGGQVTGSSGGGGTTGGPIVNTSTDR